MDKLRTNKAIEKRVKLSANNKMIRRHQFSGGHLKRKKSKGALNRAKKTMLVFKTEAKKYGRLIGI